MRKNDKILHELCLLAQDVVPVGSARIAAAIVYKRQIVGMGTNIRKSSPFQKRFGSNEEAIFGHAENVAARNAINRLGSVDFLRNSTLIVARMRIINGKWVRGRAYPCEGCSRMIEAYGIPRVVWTEDES